MTSILDQIILAQDKLRREGIVTFPAHLRSVVELSTGRVFPSANHAARDLGVPRADIHNSAAGRGGLVHGFCFAYEDDLSVDIEETARSEGTIEIKRFKIKRAAYEGLLKIARENGEALDINEAVNKILSDYIREKE